MFKKIASDIVILTFVCCLVACVCLAVENEPLGVSLSKETIGRYEKLEISVSGVGDYKRPMNPYRVKLDATLTSPSGKTIKVAGFAMHETEARPIGPHKQPKYVPVGPWLWKVRYAPDELGIYKGTVSVTAGGQVKSESEPFEFKVVPSVSKGFIRVSKTNPFVFQYDDGTPYVLIGQNLCWANDQTKASRLQRYRQWLDDMAANGCNYIRIWLGSRWSFGIEGDESKTFTEPFVYNEDAAVLMDKVLALCEQRGIAIKLCIGNNINNYLKKNGGNYNVESKEEFLRSPVAKKQWKALQRYCVARWGASTSIFAWELWNEMDHNFWGMGRQVADWSEGMCADLQRIDPHGHPTANSTGSGSQLFVLWNKPHVDFAQYHNYGNKKNNKDKTQYEIYGEPIANLRKAGKPVMLAECGIDQGTFKSDAKGYSFHEAVWVGFMAGGCGTGMHWWWDNAIEFHPATYYPQYKHFAKFVSDLPVQKEPFAPTRATVKPGNLKCYARSASWGTIAWIVNRNDRWQELLLRKKEPETVSGADLVVEVPGSGKYKIQCMDPWTGKIRAESLENTTEEGECIVKLPDFRIDIAVKVIKIE